MPDLFIITGSNGAGKSTVGKDYLPQDIQDNCPVFDGDLLYVRKSAEFFPHLIRSPKEASKKALEFVIETFEQLVEKALSENKTFAYEGHFPNDATWETPRRFKENGFITHMLFFGLLNPDLSQLRVTDRVTEGGHFVDRKTIESNFFGNLEKLDQHFDVIDELTIIDTSEEHTLLARIVDQKWESGTNYQRLPEWFTDHLPNLSSLIP